SFLAALVISSLGLESAARSEPANKAMALNKAFLFMGSLWLCFLGLRILVPGNIHAHQVASRVAAINSAVGEHGRGPAFAAEHLGPGERFESGRRGFGNHQLALFAEDDQFAVGGDERAFAEAVFSPPHVPCSQVKAFEFR